MAEPVRLAQEELDACRDAFILFDKDRSGCIDVWELKLVLESMGQRPSEEEVFNIIAEIDDNKSGAIGASPRGARKGGVRGAIRARHHHRAPHDAARAVLHCYSTGCAPGAPHCSRAWRAALPTPCVRRAVFRA